MISLFLLKSHACNAPLSLFRSASGGSVILQGGLGEHESPHDGSDGGSVIVTGGNSLGLGYDDHGGSIELTAGKARRGAGGEVLVSSGTSSEASSKSSVSPPVLFLTIL